ncbi:MAG: transcription-repair coupling factor [Chloroflexota bacterium]|nr:transcription-repair coupling factor [Chloroflexota bacterium]MDE2942219.1 transcription-repair coupling factor [Chloroflexota bacterium]MDE3267686.1 transcription-repair coupling factor [Chloroflexota bacterium]
MPLSGLFSLLSKSTQHRRLIERLRKPPSESSQAVLLDSAVSFYAGALRDELQAPVLLLTARPARSRRLYEDILVWCGEDAAVYHLPEGETLPFERLTADDATTHGRIRALAAMAGADPKSNSMPPIVVASLAAVAQQTMSRSALLEASHEITVGQRVDLAQLLDRWQQLGYRNEQAVEVPGTVSRRGGILDVFSPGSELPARIELMGNEVESLRLFDPVSQRSVMPVNSIFILPAQEALSALADPGEVGALYNSLDASNCSPVTQEQLKEELSLLMSGHALDEPGFYNGFFYQGAPLEYLPEYGLLVMERPGEIEGELLVMEKKFAELRAVKEARGDIPRRLPSLYASRSRIEDQLSTAPRRLEVYPWSPDTEATDGAPLIDLGFAPPRSYMGRLDSLASDVHAWQQDGERVVLVSQHAARLSEVLMGQGIAVQIEGELTDSPARGKVLLARGSLSEGWSLPLDDSSLRLLSDAEIMGVAKERPLRRRQPAQRAAFLSDLVPGSYLVHTDHGIGRFAGTRRMEGGDREREYLVLEYAEGDKLYVPTDQLDRVTPYTAPGERMPTLTRLGTQEWSRSKARARASTREMARELLALYASREVTSGIAFSPDTPWQQEMEDSFPYTETADQLQSIRDIKEDMETARPMDRLVCGDVGYGKTEVALRAAFKAVMDGMQVAVLAPTTVLAHQHHTTFTQRLAPFPVKVDVLSRFRTTEDQRQVTERLAAGEVDICIGTHRLLQKDVSFKNLGLVIVDEEQRFGVAHKERLKGLRREADVLTLSATPIPRTLHMALSGVRDMSTIETPPEERLAIKTYVSEFSEELVREAVLREMDRGGQVFYLHNRVRTIEEAALRVQRIAPEARVSIGHGQMAEEQLESVMADFADYGSDVLVCTTIIEAGLDMPNVNTLIVERADMLGLAQLYQLRGRVGRGANRAYAYLMVPRQYRITETAEKRLKTILAAAELGAGFRIAMRDLEIRGAGNILGAEQSGHIHAIGYDLYSQLLSQAVAELRAEQDGDNSPFLPTEVKLDLPISAYIPLHYVPDLTTRLGVYQRLARPLRIDEIGAIGEEIRDRFGPLPRAVRDLLYVVKLRALAKDVGVEAISKVGREVVLQLREPVGGARLALQKSLGTTPRVGHSQIRLNLRDGWREELVKTLEGLAKFRAEVMELSASLA